MLWLLLIFLDRTRWDAKLLWNVMYLPSGMLKKHVMLSHFKRILFSVKRFPVYLLLLLQGQAQRALIAWLRYHFTIYNFFIEALVWLRNRNNRLHCQNAWNNISFLQEIPVVERPIDDPPQGGPTDECQSDPRILESSVKDFNALTDIYWVCSFFSILCLESWISMTLIWLAGSCWNLLLLFHLGSRVI